MWLCGCACACVVVVCAGVWLWLWVVVGVGVVCGRVGACGCGWVRFFFSLIFV